MILPRHLRPRLTPRNVLCTLLAMFAVHRLLSGQPLLSSPLPEYTGPYGVGTVDIEVPAARPRRFSDAVHRDTGRPAFELETVLFSLYYPCAKGGTSSSSSSNKKQRHAWIPDGHSALYGEGYARFAGLGGWWGAAKVFETGLWSLVGSTTIPAEVDVPLLPRAEEPEGATAHGAVPTGEAAGKKRSTSGSGSRASQGHDGKGPAAAADEVDPPGQQRQQHVLQTTGVDGGPLPPGSRFPVVVFSHGFAASRTSYSQYAAELASRGYVVAAVEHRDGSAPASVVRNKATNTPPRTVLLAPRESIDPVPDVPELKRAQLAQRQAEVEETARVLRAINAGDGDVFGASSRGEGAGLPDWAGRLDTDRMVIAGHSYGATLALQALKPGAGEGEGEGDGAEGRRRPPFVAGIVLDPGKNSGRLNGDVDVPLLVVHSQSWSAKHSLFFGRPHFDAVKQIVADLLGRGRRDAWFLTARHTAHTAMLDAPLIEPTLLAWTTGATMDAYEGLMQYVNVSVDFMRHVHGGGGDIQRGELGVLGEPVSHPQYNEESRPLPPELAKYWQVHVSPVS